MTDYKAIFGKKIKFLTTDLTMSTATEGELFYSNTDSKFKVGINVKAWAAGENLPQVSSRLGACGITSAGLIWSSESPPLSPTYRDEAFTYDGTDWTASPDLGAAKAVGLVLPELNGKIHGMAFRVPTPTGSVTDFVATLQKSASADDVNLAYKESAAGQMKGIVEYTEEPIVSMDIKQNPHSSIIDGLSTMSMDGNMVKVIGWYDNEWGYSCRTSDLCAFLADNGL